MNKAADNPPRNSPALATSKAVRSNLLFASGIQKSVAHQQITNQPPIISDFSLPPELPPAIIPSGWGRMPNPNHPVEVTSAVNRGGPVTTAPMNPTTSPNIIRNLTPSKRVPTFVAPTR